MTQKALDQMNNALMMGLINPKCQIIVDDYFDMMAKVSREHQGKWDDIPKSIELAEEKKTKKAVSRSTVFEVMFQSLEHDILETMEYI